MPYFIQKNGRTHGPFTESQIKTGLKTGKLSDTDLVAQDKNGPFQELWIHAPELLTISPVTTPRPQPSTSDPQTTLKPKKQAPKKPASKNKPEPKTTQEGGPNTSLIIGATVGCSLIGLTIFITAIFLFYSVYGNSNISQNSDNQNALPLVTNSIGLELKPVPFSNANETEKHEWHMDTAGELDTRRNSSDSFFLSTTEITEAQFKKVMPEVETRWWFQKGNNLPALVHWDLAQEFCYRLSELPEEKADGRWYRLPTSAEWMYAAYANGTGDLDPDRLAWHSGNSGKKLHPVGTKDPNLWGFYDMLGNAKEWVQNAPTKEDPSFQLGDIRDAFFQFEGNGRERVVMGGGYTTVMKLSKVDTATLNAANKRYEKVTGVKRELPVNLWNLKRQKNYLETTQAGAGFRIVMLEKSQNTLGETPEQKERRTKSLARKSERKAEEKKMLQMKAEKEELDNRIADQKREQNLSIQVKTEIQRMKDLRELPNKIAQANKLLKDISELNVGDPTIRKRFEQQRILMENEIQKLQIKQQEGWQNLQQKIDANQKLLEETAEFDGEEWENDRRLLFEGISEMEKRLAEESQPSKPK